MMLSIYSFKKIIQIAKENLVGQNKSNDLGKREIERFQNLIKLDKSENKERLNEMLNEFITWCR